MLRSPTVHVILLLILGAAFFRLCLIGYEYICYTLLFIAALVAVGAYAPITVRRAVFFLTAAGLIWFCTVELLILKDAKTDADGRQKYIVVLGAAVRGNVPTLSLTNRLNGALDYLNAWPDCIAIVSGGQGKDENISEAQCMHDWLIARGIDESRILMESASTSTETNLANSFAIIRERGDEPDGNVAIVSSAYHLCRAKRIASLMGVTAAGVRGRDGYPVYRLNCYIREAFGMTQLMIFG